MTSKEKMNNKWCVFKENNPSAFVFLMIIFINVAFILLSAVLIMFLPENQDRTFVETIRFAFTLMVNPSGRYIYSDYPISTILTTVVVLLGMVSLTGGTVGYITSIINDILEKSAKSKSKVDLKDHIVILNYNNKVPAIIQDYVFDDLDSTYIVVLSAREKDEIKAKLDLSLKKKNKNVIVRDGNPMSKTDLDNISLNKAKTVIIMTPEEEGENNDGFDAGKEFEVTKLFMYVTLYLAENTEGNNTNIIVETGSRDMEYMIREYKVEESNQTVVPIGCKDIIGKVLAITTIMPSLYDVLKITFSFEAVESYIIKKESDISISEELLTTRSAMPLYDIGDYRVYIAENEEEIGRTVKKSSNEIKTDSFEPAIVFEKQQILIVGISNKLPQILESIASFSEDYECAIHVTLADTSEKADELKEIYADERYAEILNSKERGPVIIQDIYHPLNDISEEEIGKYETILFLSDEEVPFHKNDEKPLLFWSGLRKVNQNLPEQDMVVEVLSEQNQRIIVKKNKDQIVVSDSFLGCLYAQLGKDAMRLEVIKDLLTSEGDEMESEDRADLLVISVKEFFKNCKRELKFANKRELVIWVYESTGHKYLPIGCVKKGKTYMFSRTEKEGDALDSPLLIGTKDGDVLNVDSVVLEPDDEIVVVSIGVEQ